MKKVFFLVSFLIASVAWADEIGDAQNKTVSPPDSYRKNEKK